MIIPFYGYVTSVDLEKRKSFRLPVLGSQQDGELRFYDQHMPVQVLDQSSNGYAVMVDQLPNVEIGSTGLLRSGDDWFEVRLANAKPVEPPALDEQSTPESPLQFYRLGLYRLRDAIDPDHKKKLWSWPVLRVRLYNTMPANPTTIAFGLLFVFFVVVVPVSFLLYLQDWNGKKVGSSVALTKSIAAKDNSPNQQEPDWESLSPAVKNTSSLIVHAKDSAPVKHTANYVQEMSKFISGKPGASALVTQELIKELRISDKQQMQIHQIIDATNDALKKLKAEVNGQISPEQYQKLLKIARENALNLLTEEQRYHWQILSGEKPKDKNSTDTIVDK